MKGKFRGNEASERETRNLASIESISGAEREEKKKLIMNESCVVAEPC